MKKIVIFGCGGHAKVVLDVISATGEFRPAAFFDSNPKSTTWNDCPVFSNLKDLSDYSQANSLHYAAIAIGNNEVRHKYCLEAESLGFRLPVLCHTSALISPTAQIGDGTVVMPQVVINAASKIGSGCIINTGSIIEHDCSIGAFSHIAPGAVLCGGVSVGERVLFGAGSVAIPLMKIGDHVTLGAGSIVVSDIPEKTLAMGNPAKIKS